MSTLRILIVSMSADMRFCATAAAAFSASSFCSFNTYLLPPSRSPSPHNSISLYTSTLTEFPRTTSLIAPFSSTASTSNTICALLVMP
ncbi:hypothetical protein BC629DRAFT_889500 [Irpex lacteus]|nr:hypothetical protein BC629DRAFT_889500 [Irpex lacteus]